MTIDTAARVSIMLENMKAAVGYAQIRGSRAALIAVSKSRFVEKERALPPFK